LAHKDKNKDILQPIDLSLSPASQLSVPVQNIMKLFCDVTLMRKSMKNSGIDLSYMGLGELKKETLKEAFDVLKVIMVKIKEMNDHDDITEHDDKNDQDEEMNEDDDDSRPKKLSKLVPAKKKLSPAELRAKFDEITDLSNTFYTLIPHGEFSDSPVQPISTESLVKQKMETLENLIDLQIASRILIASQKRAKQMSPIDYCYLAMNSHIVYVNPTDDDFDAIQRYVFASSAKLMNVFRVSRHEEEQRFSPFAKDKNRQLLWHGSPVSNFISILSQGLRIAPPEAPRTGLMFGKGIYFADMLKKSLNYTNSHISGNISCLLLCEVALGTVYKVYHAEYMEEAKAGTNSTMGCGKNGPDHEKSFITYDGMKIPLGPIISYPQPSKDIHFSLNHNEYIVYDESRVRVKYLVQIHN
jgi:hypothetical protein